MKGHFMKHRGKHRNYLRSNMRKAAFYRVLKNLHLYK